MPCGAAQPLRAIAGQTGRRKRVRIEGPDRAHAESVLARWIQTRS